MNNKLHTNYFEQYLKETTDDFSMYPKERIWKSIYNNIHPNKKLPSIITSILILVSFFFLGHNNANQSITVSSANQLEQINQKNLFVKKEEHSILQHTASRISQQLPVVTATIAPVKILAEKNQSIKNPNNLYKDTDLLNVDKTNQSPIQYSSTLNSESPQMLLRTHSIDNKVIQQPIAQYKQEGKRNGTIAYQLYTTPSLEYSLPFAVTQSGEMIPVSSTSMLKNNNAQENNLINKEPSLNIEAGGALLIKVSDVVRIKAGMQLNYAKYKYSSMQSMALTTIGSFTSMSDQINNHSFDNTRYQISLPIGTDYKIAEINHLQWFAGATVQPSFTVMGNSYNDNSMASEYSQSFDMMRRWNVNTSIETFFSYTLKNGAVLNAGPQFRYQLFSSYGNNYNYDEKLYNIGIKLGITRNL